MNTKHMTINHLREVCPSAFAEAPHNSVSDKYLHVPSSEIITTLADYGFFPVSAVQPKCKEHGSYGKYMPSETGAHLITFEPKKRIEIAGEGNLQVILQNSSDRTRRLKLTAGLIRWACSNGLISGTGLNSVVEYHLQGREANIEARIEDVITHAGSLDSHVTRMIGEELDPRKVKQFGKDALALKYGTRTPPITADQALAPRREEDEGSNLWKVFNRTQENLVKGGIKSENTGRSTTPIATPKLLHKLNVELWDLAESYVN